MSSNLAHWEHLPPALIPTPGWVDADGCFSGCCIIDPSGRPVILYTGVRLRSNTNAGPLPPPEHDLGMVWIESQCAAVPEDPNDELLINWKKIEAPFLPLPPAEMELTGWRDPFLFAHNTLPTGVAGTPLSFRSQDGPQEYRILMGSGIKGKGGTALVYRSSDPMKGWELEGTLCEGNSEDTGVVWECPVLVPLLPVPHNQRTKSGHTPPLWLHPNTYSSVKQPSIPEGIEDVDASVGTPRKYNKSVPSIAGAGEVKLNNNTIAPSPLSALSIQQTTKHVKDLPGAALRGVASTISSLKKPAAQLLGISSNKDSPVFLGKGERSPGLGDVDSQLEFQFSSGAASPHGLGRQGSVELWPSSAEATSPSEPVAGLSSGEVRGKKSVVVGLNGNGFEVSDLAERLERAATLEHWHTEDGDNNNGEIEASNSSSSTSKDRWGSVSATIGSKLDSVGASETRLSALLEEQEHHITAGGKEQQNKTTLQSGPQSPRVRPPASPFSSTDDVNEDKFALAFSKVPALHVKPTPKNREPSAGPTELLAQMSIYSDVGIAPAPTRQWHFFTVSPDAPTNPVLYWTGFVNDGAANGAGKPPQFDIETAKGPFRLDLGDILYAPNVCQDTSGRWLLWGWLQERRKMGTYSYAGCLSLPRVLHVSDEGRLVQAPAPEVTSLRQGKEFHAQHVTLYPEAVVPLQRVSGDRLDIEVTIERGSALAAGVLLRSHEAEAEGSTAIVYDWDRNQLEAIFNVPPHWQPCTTAPVPPVHSPSSDSEEIFDLEGAVFDAAAYLCTPRFPISRTPSMNVFSPSGSSPHLHVDSGETPPMSPMSGSGSGLPFQHPGSSLSNALHRTSSFAGLGASFTGNALGTSLSRVGSFLQRPASFMPTSPRSLAVDATDAAEMDAELSNLLEDLAAPMRGAADEGQTAHVEPRRVGGPLLMRPSDRLHLRIFVDHSCIEVFTGTGEVLSTRVYRGRQPMHDGLQDTGIEFVAFGGAAILEKISAYEVESAWPETKSEVPSPTAEMEMAAPLNVQSPSKGQFLGSTPNSARASLMDRFGSSFTGGRKASFVDRFGTSFGGGQSAADRADELFDEILMSIQPTGVTATGGH